MSKLETKLSKYTKATNVVLMEGSIETGYKYWVNQNYLSRLSPEIENIDSSKYPYKWYGSFFDTKSERDYSLNCLLNYIEYSRKE